MAKAIEYKPNSAGMRHVLRSAGVEAELHRRARRAAVIADAHLARLNAPYPALEVDTSVGANRVGATIYGVPMPLERSRRILGGAISAAR